MIQYNVWYENTDTATSNNEKKIMFNIIGYNVDNNTMINSINIRKKALKMTCTLLFDDVKTIVATESVTNDIILPVIVI